MTVRSLRPRGGTLTLLGLGGYATLLGGLGLMLIAQLLPAGSTPLLGRPLAVAPVLAPEASQGAHVPKVDLLAAPAAIGKTGPDQARSFIPKQLVLPTGVVAPVLPESVRTDGSLVIPTNPLQVGWWTGGAMAGDPFGSIVIAGHVDSARFGLGVLAGLRTTRVGQVLQLRAGQQVIRYRIVQRTQVPQAQLARGTDTLRQDVPARLVVITCGGPFNRVTHRYQDNLVVVASVLP